MTHVFYFGVSDYSLQTQTIMIDQLKLSRVVFPQNKYAKEPIKRKGEQELCFINVTCSQQNTFLLDCNVNFVKIQLDQYDLWAFGTSQNGQLGVTQPTVQYPVNLSQIMQTQFKMVNGGIGFIVAYTQTKKLYIWGNNLNLNYGDVLKYCEKLSYSEQIDQNYLIQGLDFTYSFSNNRKLLIDRRTSHIPIHQADIIGLKCYNNITYIQTPQKLYSLGMQIETPMEFVGLACSQNHVLAWQKSGIVWSWGDFAEGKLGYIEFEQKQQQTPRQITQLQAKIVQCACGSNYSIALDAKGDLYAWGKGPFKMDLIRAIEPSKICQRAKPFIKIVSGDSHFGALDLSGQLYGWGVNTKGCLGNLEQETRIPKLLQLNLKVLDVGMGPFNTVIITPSNNKYKVPSLNIDQYTSYTQQRVSEETNLMRDFIDRRNKIDQMMAQSPMKASQTLVNKKFVQECEQTSNLISKMKTLVDSKKGFSKTKNSFTTLHFDTDFQSDMYAIGNYDDVESKLRKMEAQNYLYLPVTSSQTTPNSQQIKTEQEIDQVLSEEDDVLKFQYIQMVTQSNESQVMMNLLDDRKKSVEFTPKIQQINIHSQQSEKPKKIHDHFDQYDPFFLAHIKQELLKVNQERIAIQEKKQKQRDEKLKIIAEQMQMQRMPIQSREQYIRNIKKQAIEKQVKIKNVLIRKHENFQNKIHHIQQLIQEKSPEFRYKKRLDIIKVQQQMQLFQLFLFQFNVENILQIMQETSQKSLELKRLMFKEHMKARIIQNVIRKRNVIKKIKMKLGLRQKKILLSFIFRFKMYFRIKSKYTHIRKINLYTLRNQLFVKVRINLQQIIKPVSIIQQFCKWYNQVIQVQLSFLNYKWDELLRQSFKGAMSEKEKAEYKNNQLTYLPEKQAQIYSLITTPLKSWPQQLSELKFQLKPLLRATEIRTNLLKKIKPIVQIDEDYKDMKQTYQTLLPFTTYIENVTLSVNMKIRFDYQMIHQLGLHEKVFSQELLIKVDILKEHLRRLRREGIRQMRDYYIKLNELKDANKFQICNDRMKLMMKLDKKVEDQRQLKSKDDQEFRQILQKRDFTRKRYPSQIKDITFNKLRQLAQDQYPFPNLTIKLAENMFIDQKPKFKLRLAQSEWTKLFNQYQQEMKQRYLTIMNEARKNVNEKQIRQKKKK